MERPQAESYRTVRGEGRYEETIQKSRFIGIAFPAFSEAEAKAALDRVRAEFPDASSLCYGYVCGASGQLQRFYDDHEPVGGMPILDAIRKRGLIGCGCAVVRYFGGIKLGAGGLARAFGSAAIAAIDAAQPGLAERSLRYQVVFDYSLQGKMEYELAHSPHRLEQVEFGMDVTMTVLVRAADRAAFEGLVGNITNGQALYEVTEEIFSFWDSSRKVSL